MREADPLDIVETIRPLAGSDLTHRLIKRGSPSVRWGSLFVFAGELSECHP